MVNQLFMNGNQTQIYRGRRKTHGGGGGGQMTLSLSLGYFYVPKSLAEAASEPLPVKQEEKTDASFHLPSNSGLEIEKSILWTWGCPETPYGLMMELLSYSETPL